MHIDRRITNGLAWAGVLLVVGVPAADLLSGQLAGNGSAPQIAAVLPQVAPIVSETPIPAPVSQRPVVVEPETEVAAIVPVKPAATSGTAVDTYLQSGKKLPSYITGAGEPAQVAAVPTAKPTVATPAATQPVQQAATPKPIVAPPVASQPVVDPIEVAAIAAPTKLAPTPMPLSMRPAAPAPVLTAQEPVLIVPDQGVALVPDRVIAPVPPANVTASDLEDWESGPLSEFLAARQQQGNGGYQQQPSYDADGYYLEDGQTAQRPRRNQLIGPAEDVYLLPFSN